MNEKQKVCIGRIYNRKAKQLILLILIIYRDSPWLRGPAGGSRELSAMESTARPRSALPETPQGSTATTSATGTPPRARCGSQSKLRAARKW